MDPFNFHKITCGNTFIKPPTTKPSNTTKHQNDLLIHSCLIGHLINMI